MHYGQNLDVGTSITGKVIISIQKVIQILHIATLAQQLIQKLSLANKEAATYKTVVFLRTVSEQKGNNVVNANTWYLHKHVEL